MVDALELMGTLIVISGMDPAEKLRCKYHIPTKKAITITATIISILLLLLVLLVKNKCYDYY